MIVVNVKNYRVGKDVVKLAKLIQSYFGKTDDVVLAVPATELSRIEDVVELDVFAQHVDVVSDQRSTGSLGAEQLKAAGALGTLVNHSEKRLGWKDINKILKQCQEKGLRSLVCVKTYREAKWVLAQDVKPWAIAYEDAKLIGTGKSITKYRQKELQAFVSLFKGRESGRVSRALGRLNPWSGTEKASDLLAFCGAGVHTARDVRTAYALGCDGVVMSSTIVKARKPDKLLRELVALEERR